MRASIGLVLTAVTPKSEIKSGRSLLMTFATPYRTWYEVARSASEGLSEATIRQAASGLTNLAQGLTESEPEGCIPMEAVLQLALCAEQAILSLKKASSAGTKWPELRCATANAWPLHGVSSVLGVTAACVGACATSKEYREAASLLSRLASPCSGAIGTRALSVAFKSETLDMRGATMAARALGVASEVAEAASQLILNASDDELPAACALAVQVKPWRHLDANALVMRCARRELWEIASQIVASLYEKRESVDALVGAALEARRYRQADSIATRFRSDVLPELFETAKLEHTKSTIRKLCVKRHFTLIERIIEGVDDHIAEDAKRHALGELQRSREHALADRLASRWHMREMLVSNSTELSMRDEEWRATNFLQWSCTGLDKVPHPIDHPQHIASAVAPFLPTSAKIIIGFDVEWGADNRAALLQLATRTHVILIDLLSLVDRHDGQAALAEFIAPLFQSATLVGFSVHHDLTRLRASGSWFDRCQPARVVDLQQLILKILQSSRTMRSPPPGLATVAQWYLGKPLDKREQCSNWDQRPLSRAQCTYAALDAWVCAAIFPMIDNATVYNEFSRAGDAHPSSKHGEIIGDSPA